MALLEAITRFFSFEANDKVLEEATDLRNRVVKLLQRGKDHYVTVDDCAIGPMSLTRAQEEFEFRLGDANMNL